MKNDKDGEEGTQVTSRFVLFVSECGKSCVPRWGYYSDSVTLFGGPARTIGIELHQRLVQLINCTSLVLQTESL